MIVTINSKAPVEIDIDELVLLSGINDGDSTFMIRSKAKDFMCKSLGLDSVQDIETNIDDLIDIMMGEILDHLKYYIIIGEHSDEEN